MDIVNTTSDVAKATSMGGILDTSETSCVTRRLVGHKISNSGVAGARRNNVSSCTPGRTGHRAGIVLRLGWCFLFVQCGGVFFHL